MTLGSTQEAGGACSELQGTLAGCGCGCGVWGVGCGVWGVGCGVWGVGCGVWGEGSSHPALRPATLVLEDEGVIGVRVPVSGLKSEG